MGDGIKHPKDWSAWMFALFLFGPAVLLGLLLPDYLTNPVTAIAVFAMVLFLLILSRENK